MRYMGWVITGIAALSLLFSGCSKKGNVDTAPLEKSFASAEPATKSTADTAVSSIKAGDYATAMAQLQKLSAQAKLTPEQQQAVRDVLEQVKKQLSETAAGAAKDMEKAAGDLQKSLPKTP